MKHSYTFKLFAIVSCLCGMGFSAGAQSHSVARQWNEALLNAIRHDFARPTVHARNLWHTSIATYDAWAAYTSAADPYFLGDTIGDYYCPFNGVTAPAQRKAAQEEAMSYAAYRLLKQRFQNSPGAGNSIAYFDSLFAHLGYDPQYTSTAYTTGPPAALGNFIAQELIAFGLQDSSNEQNGYSNIYYSPGNPTLLPALPGNPDINDPNRWQPLTLNVYIDQSGNVIPISTPEFLSPEWGWVTAFALDTSDRELLSRDGNSYPVYHSPPSPPLIDTLNGGPSSDAYKWGFRLVSKWSSHLDTNDGVNLDISPASIGNVQWYPATMDSLPYFYDEDNGGDIGTGHSLNPVTGQSYAPQVVPRGDYARVLAEFWADGPDSETPPGHWFTIMNYVHDHPQFDKKWKGQGPVLDDLEWDVKSYFTLAGAVHDAAVAAWGLKGYYDYLRPISALRYMADQGQSSDSSLPNYSLNGIELDSGFVEQVDSLDPLVGANYEHFGKMKVRAWAGPDSIADPATDMAGVDWILAENWWPYQRPTFVTPPFAGYVSGHSTFSRAAAEVLTMITGDPYFPGGMGEFEAKKNDFLVFEKGPSTDVTLQWATYRDASDQCSLSRIWGGIHPPADDMPGRLMGIEIGTDAFELARTYWENNVPDVVALSTNVDLITDTLAGAGNFEISFSYDLPMDTSLVPVVSFPVENPAKTLALDLMLSGWVDEYTYQAIYNVTDSAEMLWDIDIRISGGVDNNSTVQPVHDAVDEFSIDMQNPYIVQLAANPSTVADRHAGASNLMLTATFNEALDTAWTPVLAFPVEDPLLKTLSANTDSTGWVDSLTYRFSFDVVDSNETLHDIDAQAGGLKDLHGNETTALDFTDHFSIDMKTPGVISIIPSVDTIRWMQAGVASFSLRINYGEDMDTAAVPDLSFPIEDPTVKTLTYNPGSSYWDSASSFVARYDVDSSFHTLLDIDVEARNAYDPAGNPQLTDLMADVFHIDIISGVDIAETEMPDWISLYPNPVQQGQVLRLSLERLETEAYLQLFDLQGRRVYAAPMPAREMSLDIPTENLRVGAYMLHLQNDRIFYTRKVVIVP